MRMVAAALVVLFGVALIIVHQRYNSAIDRAMEEESHPVPIPVGPIDSPTAASLRFTIRNIRYDQRVDWRPGQPATLTSGGDWTAFDCSAIDDPAAVFTVAMSPTAPLTGRLPIASTEAVMLVPDRTSGARMISLLARVLDRAVPAARLPSQPLKPLRATVSVLGHQFPPGEGTDLSDIGLRAGNSLQSSSEAPSSDEMQPTGPWTATRWFVEQDGLEAEFWFNYDLNGHRGEIVRKNPDDSSDLLSAMAVCLRDGPRPPRTPADDPNLTTFGPHVRDVHPVAQGSSMSYLFTPSGSLVLLGYDGTSSIQLIEPSAPLKPVLLARTDGMPVTIVCADKDEQVFLLQESAASSSPMSDPMTPWWQSSQRIWRIDRRTGKKQLLSGPWGDRGTIAGSHAVSPDGRWVAINHRVWGPDRQRIRNMFFLDLKTMEAKKAGFDSSGEVVEWTKDGAGAPMRAAVVTGGGWRLAPEMTRQCYLVDPSTGQAEVTDDLPRPDPLLSPDRTRRIVMHAREGFEIVNVATGKVSGQFQFHQDDQRYAKDGTVVWLDDRYIAFEGKRQSTIDSQTMKMCYLTLPAERRRFQFSKDFKWAAVASEAGLFMGRIAVDEEAAAAGTGSADTYSRRSGADDDDDAADDGFIAGAAPATAPAAAAMP